MTEYRGSPEKLSGMLRGWLESPRPVVHDQGRVHGVCDTCRALVFGTDETELASRMAAHRGRHREH